MGPDATVRAMAVDPINEATAPPERERRTGERRSGDRRSAERLVSVVSPTFNEADNVEPLVEALESALEGTPHEIIIVDDDSPDHTWEVAEKLAEQRPHLHVIRRFGDPGLSQAVLAGMSAARGDVIAVIDADLQHDERILPEMVDRVRSGDADVVVGTRAADGGSYGDWSTARRFVSWVATLIARLLLRVPVSDPMSGFFAISRDAYQRCGPTVNPRGFKILLEFIGRRGSGLAVSEVGYTFRNRVHGETKMSPSVIRSYLLAVVELRLGRQIKGQLVLYALVGASGAFVNLAVFTLGEIIGLPSFRTGISDWIDPVEWSVLLGIQAAIVWNFLLNNTFTFWERRFSVRQMPFGFLLFECVSVLGLVINLGVFQFLQSTGWGWNAIGREPARYLHHVIGMSVALVSNYFLNVNYTWRRRAPTA